MIRSRGLQVAGLQAAPQRGLMFGRSERRTHYMRRGAREVRVAVHGVIDEQVTREDFAEHALPFVARACDGLECLA